MGRSSLSIASTRHGAPSRWWHLVRLYDPSNSEGVELGVEVVPDDAHHELFNKDYLNYDIFISMYNIHMYNILVCTIVVLFGHLAPPPMQPVPGYSIAVRYEAT